jgi:pyrroline-5-carboxylate reductase
MGGAIVAGWRAAGIDLSSLVVIRPSGTPVEHVRVVTDYAGAGPAPKLVILGFKPQKLPEIAPGLAAQLGPDATIISILAGVETATLKQLFPGVRSIVRAMPNLPVAVRRGVVGLFSDTLDDGAKAALSQIFAPLGFAPWMPDEGRFAAVGAVAGAGPAYVARFVEALARAGQMRGLSAEIANVIALETVLGTAWMAATNNQEMADIARRVASPNGTTEAGLAVLDHDRVLDELIAVTIDAAARRGSELAEEAKAALLAAEATLP